MPPFSCLPDFLSGILFILPTAWRRYYLKRPRAAKRRSDKRQDKIPSSPYRLISLSRLLYKPWNAPPVNRHSLSPHYLK